MSNLWLVARREFVGRGKSSGYIITTIIMALVLLGTTLAPGLMSGSEEKKPLSVNLLDKTGKVAAPLQEMLKAAAAQPGARQVNLTVVSGAEEAEIDQVRKNNDLCLVIIDGSFPSGLKARFLAGSPGNLNNAGAILGPLDNVARTARIQASGINPAVATEILKPVEAEVKQVTATGEGRGQDEFFGSMLVALGVVMVLYMVVLINGQFVFQGVLEEKISRVMEVVAASVGPVEMLAGKVVGLGALGLIQFLAMMGAWIGGTLVSNQLADVPTPMPGVGVSLVALAFLVLGYLLSATLMAAAASTISRMEDQQTVIMPVTMLQVAPMLVITPVMMNPNGTLATVLSMIPIFSQAVMPMRVLMAEVPVWQILASIGLMLATTLFGVMAGGRIYRAAMLSYGTRPSMKQIWGYLKA